MTEVAADIPPGVDEEGEEEEAAGGPKAAAATAEEDIMEESEVMSDEKARLSTEEGVGLDRCCCCEKVCRGESFVGPAAIEVVMNVAAAIVFFFSGFFLYSLTGFLLCS